MTRSLANKVRNRGTAMTEMVLTLPFLILILAFLLYFGRAMVRTQRAGVMDRYEAWRQVALGAGPSANEPLGHPQLNQAFFGNGAQSIEYDAAEAFPDEAQEALADAAAGFSTPAGAFARDVFDRLPRGRTVAFSVYHANRVPAWERFEGSIRRRHTRFGNDWPYAAGWRIDDDGWHHAPPLVSHNRVIGDTFFQDFDALLTDMAATNSLADLTRRMYDQNPAYRGPDVDRQAGLN